MSNTPKFYNHINVYDFDCELPGSEETIKFKPITTGQIKRLLTYENETNYVIQEQVLDDLISSSIITDNFNIDDMYIYDRMFLLIEIRKKTKGEILEFQLTCPECNSQSLNRVDLDALEMTKPESLNNIMVEFDKVKVYLRHIKRSHQKEDIKKQMFSKKMTAAQQQYAFQIAFDACAIDKIETPDGMDENISIKDRIFFIEGIHIKHREKIEKKIDEMAFGWKLEQKVKCKHCKYEHVSNIPIQQNFFS